MIAASPKVLITNATRLHAHHHAYALQQAGMLQRFITSIWNKPDRLPYRLVSLLPGRLASATASFLSKRSHAALDPNLVEQRWALELLRLVTDMVTRGRLRDLLLFVHKGAHDRAVARRVTKLKPDVVVGYEISCPHTFESAHRSGAVTVLDLAGLHHDFTSDVARRYGVGLDDDKLVHRLRARKQRELTLADHVLTISELARRSVIAGGVPADRVSVVRLGVALDTFRPKESYRTNGRFRILFVGNLSRAKGVDILLEAFAATALPDGELVLVGSHADRKFLDKYAGTYTHLPYLDHTQLADQYRQADIFILPTLYDSWGMVVTEAMACGTPVIVSDNCGAQELVTPDCGWVVPTGSVPALSEAIKVAHANRGQFAIMGRNARTAVEGLDWSAYHRAIAARIRDIWLAHRSHALGGANGAHSVASTR